MKNVTIPSQFLQELLALCGPEDHELRERVLKSAAPTHLAEEVPARASSLLATATGLPALTEKALAEKIRSHGGYGGLAAHLIPFIAQHAAPQAAQAAVPLPLLVRDIARDLGITVPQACIALKPLGNYSTNSAVTAEMARMLRDHFPAPAHPAERATAQAVELLAADHSGMKVDYRGLFSQVQRALKRTDPFHAEMLRQLEGHLQELGQRWYAGDTAVVDELLQLYSVECQARDAIAAQAKQGGADHG